MTFFQKTAVMCWWKITPGQSPINPTLLFRCHLLYYHHWAHHLNTTHPQQSTSSTSSRQISGISIILDPLPMLILCITTIQCQNFKWFQDLMENVAHFLISCSLRDIRVSCRSQHQNLISSHPQLLGLLYLKMWIKELTHKQVFMPRIEERSFSTHKREGRIYIFIKYLFHLCKALRSYFLDISVASAVHCFCTSKDILMSWPPHENNDCFVDIFFKDEKMFFLYLRDTLQSFYFLKSYKSCHLLLFSHLGGWGGSRYSSEIRG